MSSQSGRLTRRAGTGDKALAVKALAATLFDPGSDAETLTVISRLSHCLCTSTEAGGKRWFPARKSIVFKNSYQPLCFFMMAMRSSTLLE